MARIAKRSASSGAGGGVRPAPRRARLLVAALAAAAALLAGCQAEDGDGDGGTSTGQGRSPFTGERAERGPVLAVKIDNSPEARPHTGLESADIVYAEQVEAGLSRLIAVYSATLPDRVGPVRSARESDLELLRTFGEPALAFSGAQSRLLPEIDDAPLFAASPDEVPGAYERDESRMAPHNLYVRPADLLEATPEASRADDIGFRFGPVPEGARGEPATSREVAYPGASFAFTWSAEDERWQVAMDGTPAEGLAPATVVVQEVTVRASDYHDVNGAFTPYTETTGTGEATVLRDGRAYPAEWERDSPRDGTTFTTPDGDPLPFARGQVWVVYTER
ncbi:DUF3048 domain-containing protein [Streptomyces sp. DSM 44917]|uniref:DUF3048 domain-containing protein n=1 Tax=Streptomyces boetiae TaxID=3075541 RepID=A0ABU2L782_9ACTN|nr:DUF3048 domain-containing protein [Streptomyces sp. DSM 44917]MDT0307435.1 DUF3048 domain-containing protein [Streptomyces sp. DSM 44917]